MNIHSISKENANANVTLSASELVLICNMFHEQLAKEKSNSKFLELYDVGQRFVSVWTC